MQEQRSPRRVLLKISGNALAGQGVAVPFGPRALDFIAAQLDQARQTGVQLAVVVGGGNIIRGAAFCPDGMGRLRADYAGMLATVVNVLVLRDRLEAIGVPVAHYAAVGIPRMAQAFAPERALADLESGRLVLLGGGTGSPLFTTDTAAALRAVELGADLLLKATRVDGVYTADPEKKADAQLCPRLTYAEVLKHRLRVMDLTAVSICLEHRLPLRVFSYAVEGNIRRAACGEPVGTLIGSPEDAD